MTPTEVLLLHEDIPRLSAIREIRERFARLELTADRVHYLFARAYGDLARAETERAKFILEKEKAHVRS